MPRSTRLLLANDLSGLELSKLYRMLRCAPFQPVIADSTLSPDSATAALDLAFGIKICVRMLLEVDVAMGSQGCRCVDFRGVTQLHHSTTCWYKCLPHKEQAFIKSRDMSDVNCILAVRRKYCSSPHRRVVHTPTFTPIIIRQT